MLLTQKGQLLSEAGHVTIPAFIIEGAFLSAMASHKDVIVQKLTC